MQKHSGSVRLFESDFLERFSHVHPIVPLVFWTPVIAFLVVRSFTVHQLAPWAVLGVAIAILTMKQHFLADGAAGLLLGSTAWWLLVRPHKDDPHRHPEGYATWLGPLAFLVLHIGVYAAFYLAFRAGLRP